MKMNNKDKVSVFVIILFAVVFGIVFIFWHPFVVTAAEIQDSYFVDDSTTSGNEEYKERLNNLEIRMAEMEICIDELRESIEIIGEAEQAEEEQRISISDKLDLLVIGLDDLINYSIEYLDKTDIEEDTTLEYRTTVTELLTSSEQALQDLNDTAIEQADITVSGNNLVSSLDDTIRNGNEENRDTFISIVTESTTYILIFIGIAIGSIIGLILSRFIKHG